MIQPGFALLLALFLLLLSSSGFAAPAAAQQLSASTAKLALTSSKPLFSFSGKRPTNLGVKDGQLAACPATPNCVNSQTPTADGEHAIAPIAYSASANEALAQLKSVIAALERTAIVNEADDYLYVEFTSALMGFVDDVEFYVDPAAKQIHVRSASRLGQSDLGINRQRIEAIRAKFAELGA